MEIDSLQEDLSALRKLYGLVQISESGVNSAISETLDEGSRVFLRKLLDDAAERVIQTHVKIMADDWRSVLGTKHLGQVEEGEEIQRSQPSISSYAAKSDDFDQNIKGDTLDQACALSMLDKVLDTEQSLEPVKNFGVLGDTRTSKMDCISSDKESIACSTSNVTPRNEVKGKAPNVEDFSKEVDDAIRRIESLIPSLHRLAKPVRAPTSKKLGNSDSFTKTTSVLDLDVVTESKESQTRQAYHSPRLEQMYDYESLKEGQAHITPKTHQPVHNTSCEWDGMKGNELLEKPMGRIQRTSKSHQLVSNITCERDGTSKGYEFLEGPISRIQGKQIQRTNESSTPNSKPKMDTRYGHVSQNDNVGKSCYQKEVRRKTPTSRSSTSPPSRGRIVMRNSVHRGNQVQSKGIVLENHLPSRRKSMSRESSHWSSKDNSPARYNESDETYTDSPGSSSWTTVEANSSSSPSTTSRTSSSYSVENEDARFSGSSLNSQDVDFESSGTPYITNQSSFSEGDLRSPSEYYQSSHHTVRNRGKGGFRRLKNKLGLIFHHHHHHHHHHHNKKSDQASGSVWNQFGKMFRHTEKAEAKNPKKADGSRKGKHLAKSGSRKKQIGHFHSLVEGLMKHVRHSKKAKKAKGSFGKHVRHLGENKDGKKPNWLQNLGGQRGKVKVHHKTRAKLQGRDNKPQLTARKSHSRHS